MSAANGTNGQHFTPEQVAAALTECKGLGYLAARRLGCSPRTIRRYKKRYKLVRDACEVQKGEMTDLAEAKLYEAIKNGEGWAVCFFLKTQARDRGYVQSVQVQQPAEAPMFRQEE